MKDALNDLRNRISETYGIPNDYRFHSVTAEWAKAWFDQAIITQLVSEFVLTSIENPKELIDSWKQTMSHRLGEVVATRAVFEERPGHDPLNQFTQLSLKAWVLKAK